MAKKSKILLVYDHPLVREWLANLINEQSDLHVCGEASNGPDAFQKIGEEKPDIVIVDISLEGRSGIELIKDIKFAHPDVTMVVLSMHEESLYAERTLRAGARGYIMKREATKKILHAIRAVLVGKIYVSKNISDAMAEKFVDGRPATTSSRFDQLSDRELEVFQLLGRGYSTRQIADHMRLGFKTVQTYSARLKDKLNLGNATQLLHEAIRWNENQQKK